MSAENYETGDVPPAKNPARGVYWLPNVLTTGTLFGGFYAIVAAINGDFSRAGIAIFVAMIFDGLDGRVARWTHTQSDFGKEYDSLCGASSASPTTAGSGAGSAGSPRSSTQSPPPCDWRVSMRAPRAPISATSKVCPARQRPRPSRASCG
jgi:hypothetical protein